MMKKIKQYLAGLFLAAFMLVLAGCGCGMGDNENNTTTVQESRTEQSSANGTQGSDAGSGTTAAQTKESLENGEESIPENTGTTKEDANAKETTMHGKDDNDTDVTESTGILDGVVRDVEDGVEDLTTGTTSAR